MTLRNCDAAHCSGADAELNEVCKQEGWAIGHPVITRDAQGPCQCHCSCVALHTPIASDRGAEREVQDYRAGDAVLAAGPDLKWHQVKVAFSNGTASGTQPGTVFVHYAGGELIVTPDHLFLTQAGLMRADRLTKQDTLVDADGAAVAIQEIEIGTYAGGFHHIATGTQDPGTDLTDHLLLVNGVVCADYAVQLFHRAAPARYADLSAGMLERPVVGSPAYEARHGQPTPVVGSRLGGRLAVNVPMAAGHAGAFTSQAHTRIAIPPDAVPFISDQEADRIARTVKNFRSFSDTDSQAWTQYVLDHFHTYYPEITYALDWFNNTVNAYAWIDGGGRRQVAILGGLVRHPALLIEGIALVTAHETGHHYGGPPLYPGSQLSCEGQADYAGVRNIMRKVWFGEYYLTMATRGITQMAAFFNAAEPGSDAGHAGCEHPAGACRIFTYNAAVNLAPKPSCAGA